MGSRLKALIAFRRLLAAGVTLALALPAYAGAATPGKIAFTSNRDGDNEIFTMNANGSAQIPLTSNIYSDQDPAWSPDGKQIAFFSRQDGGADAELWIMNADGSGARQLTFDMDFQDLLDWAPDGSRLVFDQSHDLFLINADGTGLRQLTFNGPGTTFYYGAHFSPDGQWIAFTNDTATGNDVLALIRSDGSGLTNLTSIDAYEPDFTADGKRLVFWTEEAPDGGPDGEIMSIAANGTDLRQLTSNSGPGSTDRDPSPSRDGLDRIAYRRNVAPNYELFVMNADGSAQMQLTFNGFTDESPDWQPTAVCQGKVATIVGTAASETLTGGPNADIISGQGGKDQISGLDNNDVACGDAGKDTLKGGNGKDVLNGGKGNDKLIGGKGKDTCIGGKGKKDTAKKCEKEKKIP